MLLRTINNLLLRCGISTISCVVKSNLVHNKTIQRQKSPPLLISNLQKTIQFIFLTIFIANWNYFCKASIIDAHRLHCMTCIPLPGDTTQLDQFRVRHRLSHPKCRMESVECLPHHDTCVTVTMQVIYNNIINFNPIRFAILFKQFILLKLNYNMN